MVAEPSTGTAVLIVTRVPRRDPVVTNPDEPRTRTGHPGVPGLLDETPAL
ncbi:hypothetical protein [Nocardia jiangsuensis]|uniref:Uncharacterized protein n=1 Tax=Nocardia jiangsuensis TaxID=1691563 RepID=A0ABV8DNG6_9NOCA